MSYFRTYVGRRRNISIGMPFKDFEMAVANYDFIGVTKIDAEGNKSQPTFFSLMIEVVVWSLFGVLARSEYCLTQIAIQVKRFKLLEIIRQLIGNIAMASSIAVAVVAFLQSAELTIGEVDITLKTAGIYLDHRQTLTDDKVTEKVIARVYFGFR